MEMTRTQRAVGRLALLFVLGLPLARPAHAIPAFARKYETSCQTCHTIFPKLNSFGNAFRLAGYRMPKETEDAVKDKPVSLGAPAYKKLWPKAVWPSDIPGHAPVAINLKFVDANSSSLNEDGSVSKVSNDFQFPAEANIFAAGTLGDKFSFYSEITFANDAGSVSTEIEHAHVGIDSPFGPENAFHFRIGKFAPNVAVVFQEAFLTTDAGIDTIFNYNPIGLNGGTGLGADGVTPNPIALPSLVNGVEAYGVLGHRFMYTAGVCNGIPLEGQFGNNQKDFYGRIDYKIGGMGLDGETFGREMSDKNWRDDSLRLGAFAYRGNAKDVNFALTDENGADVNMRDAHFLRTGFFASAYIKDLNVFGGYLHGSDTLQRVDPADGTQLSEIQPTWNAWFVQGDYVFYPWLHGAARYESLTPADRTVQSLRVGTFNVSALLRANIKVIVEYQRDLREGTNHSLDAVLRVAF
jgi:hypothetical protein